MKYVLDGIEYEVVILIKYGELTTKKGNRNYFVSKLYSSICTKLKKYNVTITW